jgi:hypothetical protein
MNIKTRKLIGVAFMAASIVAAILIQTLTGHVFESHTTRTDNLSPKVTVSAIEIVYNWRYAVPLAAVFVIGLVCWAWPRRKPPRIILST